MVELHSSMIEKSKPEALPGGSLLTKSCGGGFHALRFYCEKYKMRGQKMSKQFQKERTLTLTC